MIKRYKIDYNLFGGAGAPIIFTTGLNRITLSGFTILNNLYDILDSNDYQYMNRIKSQIYKFNNKISDFNSKYIINVSKKELKIINFILTKKLKLGYNFIL
tara:strand:- start:1 stop:303 length:303 start_codon:yes stop_codon:yes gene_type:complete